MTGGSGIGLAIAQALLQGESSRLLAALRRNYGDALSQLNSGSQAVVMDVSDAESVRRVLRSA